VPSEFSFVPLLTPHRNVHLSLSQVLNYVIPKLLSPPINAANARALAGIAEVTSTTIHLQFHVILPSLAQAVCTYIESHSEAAASEEVTAPDYGPVGDAFRSFVLAIDGPGVYPLLVVRTALPLVHHGTAHFMLSHSGRIWVSSRQLWVHPHARLVAGCWASSVATPSLISTSTSQWLSKISSIVCTMKTCKLFAPLSQPWIRLFRLWLRHHCPVALNVLRCII
jgi:hypothetical protein